MLLLPMTKSPLPITCLSHNPSPATQLHYRRWLTTYAHVAECHVNGNSYLTRMRNQLFLSIVEVAGCIQQWVRWQIVSKLIEAISTREEKGLVMIKTLSMDFWQMNWVGWVRNLGPTLNCPSNTFWTAVFSRHHQTKIIFPVTEEVRCMLTNTFIPIWSPYPWKRVWIT